MSDDLHSLRAVAAALGLPHRTVRSWAERGTLDTLQPGRNAERLVPTSELRRLERVGYRVSWAALGAADAADAADPVSLGYSGLP
jgi:hypothetical protein